MEKIEQAVEDVRAGGVLHAEECQGRTLRVHRHNESLTTRVEDLEDRRGKDHCSHCPHEEEDEDLVHLDPSSPALSQMETVRVEEEEEDSSRVTSPVRDENVPLPVVRGVVRSPCRVRLSPYPSASPSRTGGYTAIIRHYLEAAAAVRWVQGVGDATERAHASDPVLG